MCLDCNHWYKIDAEYLGFNKWHCPACNSMYLKGGFTVELIDSQKEQL